MLLHFIKDGREVVIGTMMPVSNDTVRVIMKLYPRSWLSF